jgi:hypothetical protein
MVSRNPPGHPSRGLLDVQIEKTQHEVFKSHSIKARRGDILRR